VSDFLLDYKFDNVDITMCYLQVHVPVVKYDKKVSTCLGVYCWIQFSLVLLFYGTIVPMVAVRRPLTFFAHFNIVN